MTELIKATHKGILRICETKLTFAVLEDGTKKEVRISQYMRFESDRDIIESLF